MQPRLPILTMLAAAAAAVPDAAPAQGPAPDIVLVGRTHDQWRRPVPMVEVILNRRAVVATTDAEGRFTLRISPGDSTLGFRRIGYRPMLLSLHPLPPPRDTVLVELIASEVALPEIIVSAPPSKPLRYAGTTKYDEVFLRRRLGLGTLLTRETLDRRFGATTAEMLQEVPGVRVWNGPPRQLRFPRCPEPGGVAVFVDGVRQVPAQTIRPEGSAVSSRRRAAARPALNESPEIEILDRVHPSDIEMIEVYRGAGQIPGAFHWDGCAVVAIWLRWNR